MISSSTKCPPQIVCHFLVFKSFTFSREGVGQIIVSQFQEFSLSLCDVWRSQKEAFGLTEQIGGDFYAHISDHQVNIFKGQKLLRKFNREEFSCKD